MLQKGYRAKRLAAFITAFAVVSFAGIRTFAAEAPPLTVDAKSAIIMEADTGKVLFEQNADERRAPASVTKVMTILLIYEAIAAGNINWDSVVTVSAHAASMGGSQIFLEPMEKQIVKDLTKAIVIASANDASVAMAEFIGGSEESFVGLMNKRANELGMQNTSFKNACGLDEENHFSSARDIAIMSRELMTRFPQVKEFSTTWQDSIIHKTARGESEFGLTNTNKLVRWYDGATGLKTGSTGKAMFCLSGTAEKDGMGIIAVLLAAPTPTVRFSEVAKMLDYGYANFKLACGEAPGTIMGNIKVEKGNVKEVPVAVGNQVKTVIAKSGGAVLTPEVKLDVSLKAPFSEGAKAGVIVYTLEGTEVGRSDLITTASADRAGFRDNAKRLFEMWLQ